MPIIDALGARKTEEVMRDTWGHMDAEKNKPYPGVIVFAESVYGDGSRVILKADFGEKAGYGPWFYEGIQSWLWEQEMVDEPKIYIFNGTYTLTSDDRHVFDGEVTAVDLPEVPSN